MESRKSIKTFNELPDTITPYDYADWRGVGEGKAREIFSSKGFPKIKGRRKPCFPSQAEPCCT